jgi:hypothetical protein
MPEHAFPRTTTGKNGDRGKPDSTAFDSQATFEETVSIVRNAIPKMSEHKIPMTPANYAVWFAYLTESDPELRNEMNAGSLAAARGSVD